MAMTQSRRSCLPCSPYHSAFVATQARCHAVSVACFLVLFIVLAPVFLGHSAYAQDVVPTVVYPTGVYQDDIKNVQSAVSAGGTVLLKATDQFGTPTAFNFGGPPRGVFPLKQAMGF